MKNSEKLATNHGVEERIYLIRGQRVMLSSDLADLYGVEPRSLVQAVKRNMERFPSDFMFQLTNQEVEDLKSQNVILNPWWVRRAPPYAFTEQGVAMLSGVLKGARAVAVNIEIMRAFVNLKREIYASVALSQRLDELEGRYDKNFKIVFDALRNLIAPEVRGSSKIGFHLEKKIEGKD